MSVNLQSHEIILLKSIKDGRERTVDDLSRELGADQAALVRASLTLQNEGLVVLSEDETFVVKLTREGEDAQKNGLPERQLVSEILKGGTLLRLDSIKFPGKEMALGFAKRKGYIDIEKTHNGIVIHVTKEGRESLNKKDPEEALLEKAMASKVSKGELEFLKSRRLIEYSFKIVRKIKATESGMRTAESVALKKEVSRLTPEMIKSGEWRNVEIRKYNVVAPVTQIFGGRRHFVTQAIDYVRRVWLDMGFKEMNGPLVNTAFWNFDALFVPQDHPAREMQDTFFFGRNGSLPDKKIVNAVKKAHESGVDGSSGWQCRWSEEEALRLLLRTHTTVLSARTLAQIKKDGLPAKYFAVGRVFRNEALDWKHLFEFNQVEGIVVDPDANFKNLIGYLREFFAKLGFEKARFRPGYFPYTEMSIEIDVMHPERKQWVELGGAGIFRPEVVEPLLGEPVPVLAWGPGFDRIIMDYYKVKDIRDLYGNDVKQMREMKVWMR